MIESNVFPNPESIPAFCDFSPFGTKTQELLNPLNESLATHLKDESGFFAADRRGRTQTGTTGKIFSGFQLAKTERGAQAL